MPCQVVTRGADMAGPQKPRGQELTYKKSLNHATHSKWKRVTVESLIE
jgi:hypothetical protein